MVARVNTITFNGIDVLRIDVQVQISNGLPSFQIVGLPDKAVAESKERVRSALHAIGLSLPSKRLTVNLSPADVQKEGSHFDLPIALGVLRAMDVIPEDVLESFFVMGELALDGRLTPVHGVLPAAIQASGQGFGLICPEQTGAEAAWAGDIDILAPNNLISLINHFKGTQILTRPQIQLPDNVNDNSFMLDFADVKGQETAKRALEIAAAGNHNVLMIGPPGSGKSMLASRLPSILPELTPAKALETSMIQSISGQLKDGRITLVPSYRDPHHSASLPALVGGGQKAKPGEISLAHNGVLFLDELPEFSKAVLESLRQPVETGSVLISRANHHVTYPADFQLIAAMNPCRCGYLGDASRCSCSPKSVQDYQSKISGPMMDRFDIFVEVPALSAEELLQTGKGEKSSVIKDRILRARETQRLRYKDHNFETNSDSYGEVLEKTAVPDADGKVLLQTAIEKMKLSGRGYHRVLKVARTIADLEGSATLKKAHIAEALAFRQFIS